MQSGVLTDVHVLVHDATLDDGAGTNDRVVADHGGPADHRTGLDANVATDQDGTGDRGLGRDVRPFAHPHPVGHLEPGGVQRDATGESVDVHGAVPVQRADVLPVGLRDVARHRTALAEQRRDDVGSPVESGPVGQRGQDVRLDHVDAGVHEVRHHPTPARLLHEPRDPAGIVQNGTAVLDRLVHPGEPHGEVRPGRRVMGHECGQVEIRDGVARDHQHRTVRKQGLGVLDASCCPERYLLGRVPQSHPQVRPVAGVRTHEGGEKLDGDHGVGDAVPAEQSQDVLEHRAVQHGQQRLGQAGGERTQPGPLTTSHHDRRDHGAATPPGERWARTSRRASSRYSTAATQ